MIIYLALIIMICAGWSVAWNESTKRRLLSKAHLAETASIERVGKWYEHRVAELENETRQLAEQVIASGSVVHHAMPLQPAQELKEYRSDPTGLYVEEVDPREYAE